MNESLEPGEESEAPDPRALSIAQQHFPDAVCRAEKRGIHTFVDIEESLNPLDAGLYIFDEFKNRLIHVIRRSNGDNAALGRSLDVIDESPLH